MNRLCPHCQQPVEEWRNPAPCVDVVILHQKRGVVLIKRANEPFGYALPGGFVEYGESVETAAVREAMEETGLSINLIGLLGIYSDPGRDPRRHTLSTVYVAEAGNPDDLCAGDDAAEAAFYLLDAVPELAFDHARILRHAREWLRGKRTLAPVTGYHD